MLHNKFDYSQIFSILIFKKYIYNLKTFQLNYEIKKEEETDDRKKKIKEFQYWLLLKIMNKIKSILILKKNLKIVLEELNSFC